MQVMNFLSPGKLTGLFSSKLEFLSIRKRLQLGFGLILGFMVSVVVVTLIGLALVLYNINAVVHEQQPAVFSALKLGEHVKDASGSLGLYLLGKEDVYHEKYQASFAKIEDTLKQLRTLDPIQEDAQSLELVLGIESDIEQFREYEAKLFELAADDSQNFPGILYAAQNLNPLSQQILNNLYTMIDSQQQRPASEAGQSLLVTIEDLRYNWTNVMNGVRAYLAYRNQRSLDNVKLREEQTRELLNRLSARRDETGAAALSFEQIDALETTIDLVNQFFTNVEELKQIHGSDQWRQDAYLIRSEVGALLRSIDNKLASLETRSRNKIDDANSFLISEVGVIIIIAIVLLIGAFFAASRISMRLIKDIVDPLNDAVEATGRIASGDLTVKLEEKSEDEIGQLISSLNMMTANLSALVSSVQRSGVQVTSSSTEIAATAKQQEATVTEQAATANQISTTAKEISATVHELVDTMDQVNGVAETTATSAADSQSALASMEQTMHQMMDATGSISSKLSVLSEKASNINSVVTTITKVADQTNLLSLNAAIEAEKAGEYGVGFSVVANEIRRLADQTAVATWDIEQMVKEMQSAVSAGVMGMDKFTEEVKRGVEEVRQVGMQLAQIIEQVQALLPRFESVHEGMQNQADGAQQITESITQLSDGTQQTAESLRQSRGAIEQLNNASRMLQDGVSKFKIERST